jgi:hypothetical protein
MKPTILNCASQTCGCMKQPACRKDCWRRRDVCRTCEHNKTRTCAVMVGGVNRSGK